LQYGKKFMMLKSLKIAHLTSVHKRFDSRIFNKQCISLSKKDNYDVCLIVADGLGSASKDNINIYDVGSSKNRFDRVFISVKKIYLKALDLDCDVYHLHDPELLNIGLKLKNQGKKVIFDSHEDVSEDIMIKDWIPVYLRKFISFIYNAYEKSICKQLDFVISATPYIRNKFQEKGIKSLDIKNYPLKEDFDYQKTNWDDKKDEICYVGEISKERGIIELINSLEYLKNIRLNLVGSFSDSNLKSRCEKMKGWSKVNELGFLSKKEIDKVFNNSKLGIATLHPTKTYLPSIPVKIFEYMAAGLPIICSNFDFWNELIFKKYKCAIQVDPLSSRKIADAIELLIYSDIDSKKMIDEGTRAVKETFNWKVEEKKLYDIYNSI